MKAYRYYGDKNFKMDELPMPTAGKGEAVAKVKAASICGTDLRLFRFGSNKIKPPMTIGHEACYEIVETGEGVNLNVGSRYVMAPAIGCGHCKSCQKGRSNMCDNLMTIGFQYAGTFAEYMKIPAKAIEQGHMIEVNSDISDEVASAVEPVACAINAQNYLDIQQGDNVLIYGAGYLGCIHAELAYIKGAENVIIAEISEKRRNKAKSLVPQATVIDSGQKEYVQQISHIVGDLGIDVVIAACPAGITHKQGLELLYKNGRISLFGGLPGDTNYHLDSNLIHYKEASVYGAHASTVAQNKEALELVNSGELDIGKYISVFNLKNVEEAFNALIEEVAEKAILKP